MNAAATFDLDAMIRNGRVFVDSDGDLELLDALNVVEAALVDRCDPVALEPSISAELARLGIEGEVLSDLFVATVRFDRDGFEFIYNLDSADLAMWRRAVVAVIVPVRDELNTAYDLVAWNLRTGATAIWLGAASILGEFNLLWRLGEEALRIRPTVLDWLRAECDGLVILNAAEARWRLIDEALIVADAAFGVRLRDALRLPEPKIFVGRAA
jgi:hypothetical protein